MTSLLNSSISVDIVVFRYKNNELQVLLLEKNPSNDSERELKLPGSMLTDDVDLDTCAQRTLLDLAGLKDMYIEQLHVFSSPTRLSTSDMLWIEATYGVKDRRVVTVAYISLVKPGLGKGALAVENNWVNVSMLTKVAFDHLSIIEEGIVRLRQMIDYSSAAFDLLPKKFTIKQLQSLYEAVQGVSIDNRNFRKKILKLPYLIALDEKELNVNHKPATLYKFDHWGFKNAYSKIKKTKIF